ncbi:PHP domain-containing protein [bacterium]|nr:MAG: PHP domain-containing protein [bacterium]
MGIDLHAHTTASDGSFTPYELVAHAKLRGLSAVAVTDHDTFGGHEEALAAGAELGIEIVPGIELSVKDELGDKSHLLGYYVDAQGELSQQLAYLQAERDARNIVILDKLASLGVPITMERVLEIARGGVTGRPHIAQALMEKRYVASVQEAFDKYLADGSAAAASKEVLHPAEAIELIHAGGGVAIWAHPTRPPSKRGGGLVDFDEWEVKLQRWIEWGLDGIEIYYSQYLPEEAEWTLRMVEKYGLLGTGGSDFHGTTKPTIELGVTHTGEALPDAVLDMLKAKRRV